jgi:hypothetical protein
MMVSALAKSEGRRLKDEQADKYVEYIFRKATKSGADRIGKKELF